MSTRIAETMPPQAPPDISVDGFWLLLLLLLLFATDCEGGRCECQTKPKTKKSQKPGESCIVEKNKKREITTGKYSHEVNSSL